MEQTNKKFFTTKTLVLLAMFTALTIVMQALAFTLPAIGGVSFTFSLVPLVLGGVYFGNQNYKFAGIFVGAYLGLLFGVLTCFDALTGGMTTFLFAKRPVLTIVTCLTKGLFAGLIPAVIFKLLHKKNAYVAVILASIVAPIVNTGLFIVFMFIMLGTVKEFMGANNLGDNAVYFLFIGCAGINFIVELIINIVVSPVIFTVQKLVGKNRV